MRACQSQLRHIEARRYQYAGINRTGLAQALEGGNYRTPGCSYCHLHNGNHGDTMAPEHGSELRHWICAGCQPRYVREQFANAKRQVGADLKLEEGVRLSPR